MIRLVLQAINKLVNNWLVNRGGHPAVVNAGVWNQRGCAETLLSAQHYSNLYVTLCRSLAHIQQHILAINQRHISCKFIEASCQN